MSNGREPALTEQPLICGDDDIYTLYFLERERERDVERFGCVLSRLWACVGLNKQRAQVLTSGKFDILGFNWMSILVVMNELPFFFRIHMHKNHNFAIGRRGKKKERIGMK